MGAPSSECTRQEMQNEGQHPTRHAYFFLVRPFSLPLQQLLGPCRNGSSSPSSLSMGRSHLSPTTTHTHTDFLGATRASRALPCQFLCGGTARPRNCTPCGPSGIALWVKCKCNLKMYNLDTIASSTILSSFVRVRAEVWGATVAHASVGTRTSRARRSDPDTSGTQGCNAYLICRFCFLPCLPASLETVIVSAFGLSDTEMGAGDTLYECLCVGLTRGECWVKGVSRD